MVHELEVLRGEIYIRRIRVFLCLLCKYDRFGITSIIAIIVVLMLDTMVPGSSETSQRQPPQSKEVLMP